MNGLINGLAGVITPISGVITLLITSRGPLCSRMHGFMPTRCKHRRTGPGGATWWATRAIEHLWLWEEFFLGVKKVQGEREQKTTPGRHHPHDEPAGNDGWRSPVGDMEFLRRFPWFLSCNARRWEHFWESIVEYIIYTIYIYIYIFIPSKFNIPLEK